MEYEMSEIDWYVTVGDNQVGPVDINEIKRLWANKEVTEDSHVWCPGMDDWTPIVDVSDFSDILKKNLYVDHTVRLEQLNRDWRPTTGATLIELMKQELTKPELKPKSEKKPDPLLPDLKISVDLFPSTPSFDIPIIPEEREKTTGRWVILALSIIAIGILITGFFAFKKAQQAELVREFEESKQVVAVQPVLPPIPEPVVESLATEKQEVKKIEKSRKKRGVKKEKRVPVKKTVQLEKLTVKQIVATVKRQVRSVKRCIAAANSNKELVKGKHILRLSWTIEANGSVSQPRVTGPDYLAKTSLNECMPRAMSKWKFPVSSGSSPVRNFPLGPFTIK